MRPGLRSPRVEASALVSPVCGRLSLSLHGSCASLVFTCVLQTPHGLCCRVDVHNTNIHDPPLGDPPLKACTRPCVQQRWPLTRCDAVAQERLAATKFFKSAAGTKLVAESTPSTEQEAAAAAGSMDVDSKPAAPKKPNAIMVNKIKAAIEVRAPHNMGCPPKRWP